MAEIPDEGALEAVIPDSETGRRLDQALAALFPDYSRSLLSRWLKEGRVTVDGGFPRPRDRVAGGEVVAVTPETGGEPRWEPEALPLAVVHADEDLLVIDKPAGLVVHPGAGNPS
ncbi:MAG: S4 domain-containing protein, partial [Thiohalospira sp.]